MEENTKGERREEKRRRQRQKMRQHGKGLSKMYKDAIVNRLERKRKR